MIEFVVPAVPVAQPRQRHALIAGHVRNYTPSRHPVQAFKATCKLAAAAAYDGPPLAGPLRVDCIFVLPRPKSTPKRLRFRLPHAKRPDVENLAKSLWDALTGILWLDDAQIQLAVIGKWVASADEQPHVEVWISQLETT